LRDILTVIAALVIAVLTAAVAVPPFIDWGERRATIDGVLSRATATDARTRGRIEVRLLPSPRIQVDALELGGSTPSSPSLRADTVVAEIELMPILSGHVRFTEVRLGRAEIRVPTGTGGKWRLPADLPAVTGLRREWAIDNLAVRQLYVTTTTPTTGRTDQYYFENVHIEGQSLAGPWRLEAMTGGVPFRLGTGELGDDQTVQVKVAGGGDVHPRFDIDAKLAFENEGNAWIPSVSGVAKVLFGPPAQVSAAGLPIPVAIQAAFKVTDGLLYSPELEQVAVEAGEGGASLRLTGAGRVGGDDPRVSLKLEGRRLDVDSFLLSASGRELVTRAGTWSLPPITVPIDLDLSLNSIGLAQDELSDLVARLTFDRGRAEIEHIAVEAPGQTRVKLAAKVGLTTEGGGSGRIEVTSAASDRLARYLAKLGLSGPFAAFLDGRRLEAAADVVHSAPVTSFENVSVKIGESTLNGQVHYTEPEASARGQLRARITVQELDLGRLPRMSSLFEGTHNLDLDFTLDARDVRHAGSKGAGRISARILSDAPSLKVETLQITDLAGANAQVSGRIEPDGSGRIEGRVTAERAAPLVDLLGTVWIGGVAKFVPHFLREGELNINVVAERAAPSASGGLRLKTTARGTAAGGLFAAEVLSADGYTENLNLKLATDNTGLWVDRPDAAPLRRPSHLDLRGVRVPSGNFNVMVAGDVGGVRINTTRPVALGAGDDVIDSGEADLSTADLTPFLVLLGDGAGVEPPVPAQIRVTLGRERDASLVTLSGRIADAGIQARLWGRTRSEVTGSVTAERLSMPWLAAAFALNAPPDPRATSLWSMARFGQTRRVLNGGEATFNVARLDLGRELVGRDASFVLGLTQDGIAVRDFKAALAGGELIGAFSISRQGSLASVAGEGAVRDVPLTGLSSGSAFDGKISGTLKFGAAGETMSGLVANLAGAGTARIADFGIANADPGALERSIARALKESDPMAARRLEAIVAEELNRGPLRGQVLSAPTTLIGGALRISPFIADAGAANWQGAVSLDFKTLALETKGALSAKTIPKGWTGNPPYVHLGWRGPLNKSVREIDVGPLVNGLAGIVLQRELEKIESFEADANERARINQRRSMDWSREQARQAEEAARQREEEAARNRAVEEARRRAEEARQVRLRQQQQEERARGLQNFYGPMDIKPPAQNQQPPG
jgi:uncharacterized protein involved in outer membrane biogenesis